MSPIPIDEAGIEKTAIDRHEGLRALIGCGGRWSVLSDVSKERAINVERATVSAYLGAVGAEVEREKGAEGGMTYHHERVVFPWKPLTDTKDGMCKERSAAGSECYHHDGHDTPHSWEEITDTEEETDGR